MKVKVINKSKHPLPKYETGQSAGVDIHANLETPLRLASMERALIPTGLFMELPVGYEAQVRPRSGLAIKYGITLLNAPGTIDADYRGEVKVIVANMSNEVFVVEDGMRIAQIVIAKCEMANWVQVNEISETDRGAGGFGHTGLK